MKKSILLILSLIFFSFCYSQDSTKQKLTFNPKKPVFEVEATCGNCMFKMGGKGCELAIKLNGKNYFVDGTGIDDHGDAHESDGFCNAIRKAKVQGDVVGDKFKVTYFELIKK